MDYDNQDKQTVLVVVDAQNKTLKPRDGKYKEKDEQYIQKVTSELEEYVDDLRESGAKIIWLRSSKNGEVHSNMATLRGDSNIKREDTAIYDYNKPLLEELDDIAQKTGKPLDVLICGFNSEGDVTYTFADLRANRPFGENHDTRVVEDKVFHSCGAHVFEGAKLDTLSREYPEPFVQSKETFSEHYRIEKIYAEYDGREHDEPPCIG